MQQLDRKLLELDKALADDDMQAIGLLGHWLKGAGGTGGFDQFTDLGIELANTARDSSTAKCGSLIEQVWYMGSQIVIESMQKY